jgi:hypothetical protein
VGLTRFDYVRSVTFQSTTKFLPSSRRVLASLLFIADKFGDLSLHELESLEIAGSGTGRVPLAPVRISLVNEAQLGHGSNILGEAESDPLEDKADHHEIGCPPATDPIHQSPPESDSDDSREVYMVAHGEQPTEKTIEEIAQEVEEEMARAAWLAQAVAGKRCNGRQDASGSSDDDARDGTPFGGYHPKYN